MTPSQPNYNAFERVCAEAVGCDRCFPKMGVARASIDLAQPRYVGPNYWSATERRLFLMINPGSGIGSISDETMRREIRSYRAQSLSLEELFQRQREHMPEWGRGKFLAFIQKLGSSLDDIALLNVAWCATQGDKYPTEMLRTCFATHTRRALAALQPTTLIACGGVAQKFAKSAGLSFVAAPHYAARFTLDFAAIRKVMFEVLQEVGPELLEAFVDALDESSKKENQLGARRKQRFSDLDRIRLVVLSNPKTGKSARRFDCYRSGMTVAEYRAEVGRRLGPAEAGKCRADLRWDLDRNFISIKPR